MPRASRLIPKRARPAGFTLLEVLLALALTVLVLGALTMAIQVILRATSSGRADVAKAQLARAVLRRISDDLRSAVWYEPIEIDLSAAGTGGQPGSSGGQSPAGSSSGGDGSNPSGSSSGGNGGPSSGPPGGGSSGSSSAGSSSNTSGSGTGSSSAGSSSGTAGDNQSSSSSAPMAGLFGGPNWIEVDVSRLPRADQYERSISATDASPLELTSDVKTVAYYLAGSLTTATSSGTGLMRRQVDRAVTQWAALNGNLAGLDQSAQALAPEVVAIQFKYFDGYESFTEWDSDARKGLPMAVEITIELGSQPVDRSEIDLDRLAEGNIYQLVVHLPAARPADGSDGADDSSSGSASQSNTSSAGGSSSSSSNSSGSQR